MQPKQQRWALWAVFFATAAVRLGYSAIAPVLPLYVQQHGVSTMMIAFMANAYVIALTFFQSPAGHLGDRIGRRPVMLLGTLLYTVAAALFVYDGGPWFYVLLRFIEGLGASAFGPNARAFVADLVPEGQRGKVFGQLTSFDMVGVLIGPVVGGVAQRLWGPLAPFIVCAVLGLLAGVPLLLFVHNRQTGEQGTAVQSPPEHRAADRAPAASVRGLLRTPAFWAVVLPSLGFSYFNGLYGVAWSLYMHDHGATHPQIDLSYTAFALPMVFLLVPFGVLAERVGRPLFIALGGFLSMLATLGYAFFPAPWALVGLNLLDGTAASAFLPANQSYMADVAPARSRGKFFGLVSSISSAGTILFTFAVGYLYDHVASLWLFVAGVLAVLIGCGGAVWLMSRRSVADTRTLLEGSAA